jgi:hypothetical protein
MGTENNYVSVTHRQKRNGAIAMQLAMPRATLTYHLSFCLYIAGPTVAGHTGFITNISVTIFIPQ